MIQKVADLRECAVIGKHYLVETVRIIGPS